MTQRITTDRPLGVVSDRRYQASSPALTQRRMRDIHLYLSMLFAPSLLFFAVTGALQLFNLHEVRPDRSFEPPVLLQELGMVHKDQVFTVPHRRGPQASPQGAGAPTETQPAVAVPLPPAPPPDAGRRSGWQVLALKIFFLLAAIGLLASTCLGIWIGLRPGRNRRPGICLFIVGAAIPVMLLLF